METSPVITPDQLMTPAVFADPYPVYQQLRAQSPVSYFVPAGTIPGFDDPVQPWALMRYDDVYGALRDHQTFSSEDPRAGRFGPKLVLIQDDPPRHTRFRRLVNKAFTARTINNLRPFIRATAERLAERLASKEACEFIEDFANPMPLAVMCELLGVPPEDYDTSGSGRPTSG